MLLVARLLIEVEEVIEKMPPEASASTYRALLSACKNQPNMEIRQWIARKLLCLEPHDSSAYVILSTNAML